MRETDLILTLTGCLAAALVCGYGTRRLGLSPIVGYLLAGVVVGPNTPGFIANPHLAEQLAEVGVILLMFGVGLQFHVEELLAVRRVAIPGAVAQSVVATVLGTLVGLAWGWGWSAGIVFGLAISVASTVVLVRVLADNGELDTTSGKIAIGWLVVEDLFTVLVLVLLPAVFGPAAAGVGRLAAVVGLAMFKVGVMVALTFLAGGRLVPWLLDRVASTRSRELFTLTVLVVALGIAVGAARLFDVSMALGAFLAGMVVGRSEFSLRAASEALPMRDAFAVLFFVSVGLLFDPRQLITAPGLVAATLAVILLGKPLVSVAIVLLLGYPMRVAVAVAAALAQIGEFSFILAGAGKSLGIVDDRATSALVAAGMISIAINPLLYSTIGPLGCLMRRLEHQARGAPPASAAANESEPACEPGLPRALVVGHGPVGQTICRLLRENRLQPVVIELNLQTVRNLAEEGQPAIYGDARQRLILVDAGIEDATALILGASDSGEMPEIIRAARELNPRLRIIVRTAYLRQGEELRRAGADAVFSDEGEVALAMTEFLLGRLGARAEQVDREKERIRVEILGGSPEMPRFFIDAPEDRSDHALPRP